MEKQTNRISKQTHQENVTSIKTKIGIISIPNSTKSTRTYKKENNDNKKRHNREVL